MKPTGVFPSPSPRYDYVFIDEAQDLDPVALRMCKKEHKGESPKEGSLTATSRENMAQFL
jgi:superfamily I DNA/RNA helicase